MVGSYGVDASVVASWVGWIRTLTSVLVVSLSGIVSSAGALSWSYGLWWFKEVSNGVRDFVCVISGYAGFSSSDAWSRGFVGIFTTSLGFIRCFRKPPSISQVNFAAWRPFRSLEVISQPFRSPKAIFATKGHFRSQGAFSQPISQQKGNFAAHFVAHFAAWRWFRKESLFSQGILLAVKFSQEHKFLYFCVFLVPYGFPSLLLKFSWFWSFKNLC